MLKDSTFDQWNEKKKCIHEKKEGKHFKERDILFIHLGENIGFEQNGKGKDFIRPVLVYKKFASNLFLGIPLTSQEKEDIFYYSFFIKGKKSTAILSQMRLFDAKRIKYFYARLNEQSFEKIKQKLIELLQ